MYQCSVLRLTAISGDTTLHRLIGVGGLLSWCLILQGPTGIQEAAWTAFH